MSKPFPCCQCCKHCDDEADQWYSLFCDYANGSTVTNPSAVSPTTAIYGGNGWYYYWENLDLPTSFFNGLLINYSNLPIIGTSGTTQTQRAGSIEVPGVSFTATYWTRKLDGLGNELIPWASEIVTFNHFDIVINTWSNCGKRTIRFWFYCRMTGGSGTVFHSDQDLHTGGMLGSSLLTAGHVMLGQSNDNPPQTTRCAMPLVTTAGTGHRDKIKATAPSDSLQYNSGVNLSAYDGTATTSHDSTISCGIVEEPPPP